MPGSPLPPSSPSAISISSREAHAPRPQPKSRTPRRSAFVPRLLAIIAAAAALTTSSANALPQFSRMYQTSCNTCHTVVPRLNLTGMDFLARGYRPAPELKRKKHAVFPIGLWLSGRADDQISKHESATYFNKAEILLADSVGSNFNYMVEWRVQDLDAQSNGSLRDRSGRFEDAWMSWQLSSRLTFTMGQYRPLGQVEAGRKISISTPAIFDTSVAGGGRTARLRAVDTFSPNTRSPGFTIGYQSIGGRMNDLAMNGLFHQVTLPFVGELSLPLNQNARQYASFELEPRIRGVVLETWYRHNYSSIGVHGFIDTNRYLANLVAQTNRGDLYVTGGVGFAKSNGQQARMTSTLEMEYLPTLPDGRFRPGFGLRIDNVSHNGTKPAFVPYLVLSTPNTKNFSSLIQIEYLKQAGHDRFRVDVSALF